ncbi:hypothetical protein H6P81_004164 [Aristolochia fimbriata]|uniref:AFG1-like ATPase n=1 Tax=Aristolochia fimbriata TaxID=158543 RepID=A0AAV7FHA8_ARIFI|nr:hypothetical protein H6P81_004164 [Aristolochia fimbriata]
MARQMGRFYALSAFLLRSKSISSVDTSLISPRTSGIRCYCNQSCTAAERRPGPLTLYNRLVEQGQLKHDIYQEKVASELEDLLGRLERYEKDMEEYHKNLAEWEKNRENERRRLLLEEAELKQQGKEKVVKKSRLEFVNKWIIRRGNVKVEQGAGKMVSYINREKKLDSLVGKRPSAPKAPKGLYLYGNVGSGKTMLMDMFYSATQGIVKHRRRFHFHEAMLVINEQMHKVWKEQVEGKSIQSVVSSWIERLPFDTRVKEWLSEEENYKREVHMKHILLAVADKFLIDRETKQRGASVLCFDEVQTVDVFAIVALSGIVSRVLCTGTVLVATSNRAPEDLNQDGMQRDIFQNFVSKLGEHCQNILVGSDIDYRRLLARRTIEQIHYFWPLDSLSLKEFEKMWGQIVEESGGSIISCTIPVMFGRKLEVPESCNGVARFSFDYLCGSPVGAADFIAIAKNYHTVFISSIPVMSMRIRDKARRFITLIDELYNHHCRLVCTAAASIDDLFQGTDDGTLFDLESFQFETEIEDGKLRRDVLAAGSSGSTPSPAGIASLLSGQEEMFAFRRAVSRLYEMQTSLYLEGIEQFHPYFERSCRQKAADGQAF